MPVGLVDVGDLFREEATVRAGMFNAPDDGSESHADHVLPRGALASTLKSPDQDSCSPVS